MSTLRDEAEALAIALEIGAADVDIAIGWADSYITALDAPHWSLCEVSTSWNKYPQDIASDLRNVPGTANAAVAHGLLVQMIAQGLTPACADSVASSLYQLACADELEDPDLRELAWWAWDALDLADAGYIRESREDIISRMREVLGRAAARAAADGPRWKFP